MEKSMKEIFIEKCGFYLPECAYYDFINDTPDDANKATLVKKAMEAIEDENPKMDGVLPKEVYAQLVLEEEPELLSNIVRIFKDIPENSTIDVFGEIYEYFLGNFALAEGKGCLLYTSSEKSLMKDRQLVLSMSEARSEHVIKVLPKMISVSRPILWMHVKKDRA